MQLDPVLKDQLQVTDGEGTFQSLASPAPWESNPRSSSFTVGAWKGADGPYRVGWGGEGES